MKRIAILTVATAILTAMIGTARADSCEDYTTTYERTNGIPAGLLTAIAHVESGRADAAGAVRAWPWTVTSPEGDVKHATKWDAITAVQDLRRRGITNIDVGCMQVNLRHHPNAFRNLNVAFDPEANVAYGANYLMQQYRRTGDWRLAAAHYHSTNPEHAGPYAERVENLWRLARADARFYGFDDVRVADAAADNDWATWRNYPYWADPHWTGGRFDRRWHDFRVSRPIRWYGNRAAAPAGANDHAGPWRPVGTSRFN